MTDSTNPACGVPPRCPRCGAALVPADLPPGVFGIAGEACYECDEGASARPRPWACRACGGVWLLDAAAGTSAGD